jgi:nucleoside-diphosphate-sugar epimerase
VLLLDRGFKVRVATRSVGKQEPFRAALEGKYGQGSVEFIEVEDFTLEQSWERMLQGKLYLTQAGLIDIGVHGVQHLASDVSFSSDYEKVVNASRDMTTTFLHAVRKHDSVKSVVLTSSRIAAYNPVYGKDIHVTKNDWTDYFLDLAQNARAEDPMAPMMICES